MAEENGPIRPEGRRTGPARESRRALRVAVALLLPAAAVAWILRSPGAAEPEVRTVSVPTPPPAVEFADTLRRGQTLGEVFGAYGLSGAEIEHLVGLIRRYESPRRLRPGTVVRLAMRPAEPPDRIRLELDRDRRLHLFLDGEVRAWGARLDSVPVVTDTVVVGGLIRSNLYEAELFGDGTGLARGEVFDLVHRLARVFAWQIDFYRDIRVGDLYRVAVERAVRPDGSVRTARILSAEFHNAGRVRRAIRFEVEGEVEFYDDEGEALRSVFLRAPLEFARMTSGFTYRRYHPVLRQSRPHLGVDYGAPTGTPIRATGAGVVTRAGWWGGYGRVVEIRHINNLRTRYAHMSRVASGIRPGARVSQGQTIGFVGSTGLSTAPHVHYEFLQNGRQVNPARLDLPRADPVPASERPRFELQRDGALALLERVAFPPRALAADVASRAAGGPD